MSIDNDEYQFRLDKLKAGMRQAGIDIALLTVSADVYYFSGTAVYSVLVVPVEGDPLLLVRINYERAAEECRLNKENIRRSQGLKSIQECLLELKKENAVIGIAKDVVTASFIESLKRLLPRLDYRGISPIVLNIRMKKSPQEIAILKRASYIQEKTFIKCEELIGNGISEVELQCELEKVQRIAGAEESMLIRGFEPNPFGVLCSGPNTAIISGSFIAITGLGTSSAHPFGASRRKIQKGDLVVVNKGVRLQGYHSDEARTFVFGKPSAEQRKYWNILKEIQDAALAKIRPGVCVAEVYNAAKKVAVQNKCEDYFMGYGLYGVEYVGHGTGLEIDEPPLIGPKNTALIEEGMTLAIEPKLVIFGRYGMDLENSVVVTSQGNEILCDYPREFMCIA